jgi:hypothetical protein
VVLSVDADNAAVSVPRELGAGERARASTPPPRLSAEEEEKEDAVDVELGEIRVVPADGASSEKEKGKKAEKKAEAEDEDDDDDEERYCRICMERIARAELDAGSATSLGCACVGGFAHVNPCAEQYANAKSDATCEVSVFAFLLVSVLSKTLTHPSPSRARSCAWRTWTRWTPSSRSCARRDAIALEDARLYRPGWGSRNPGMWLLWIITRPFVLVAYVSLYFVTCLVAAAAAPLVLLFCPEFLDASFFRPDVVSFQSD